VSNNGRSVKGLRIIIKLDDVPHDDVPPRRPFTLTLHDIL
jgi:hypothetical protein